MLNGLKRSPLRECRSNRRTASRTISVNVVRWGGLPIFFQVANAKISDGLFYQTMTVLGVLYLHQITRLTQKTEQVLIEVDWFTASHWLFRWLHGPFNRRLLRLQCQQDREDNEIMRGQRLVLRKRGYRFATDVPDFRNSSDLGDNMVAPPLGRVHEVPLSSLPETGYGRVQTGPIGFHAQRNGDAVMLWPDVCPHEGGKLCPEAMQGDRMVCPWHGRLIDPVTLDPRTPEGQFLNVSITLADDLLRIQPAG